MNARTTYNVTIAQNEDEACTIDRYSIDGKTIGKIYRNAGDTVWSMEYRDGWGAMKFECYRTALDNLFYLHKTGVGNGK